MKKYSFKILLLLLITYFVFEFFYNRYRISTLHYGVKANALRQRLHIPIIDDYMKAKNKHSEYFGNRWESHRDLPTDRRPLHVWKIVTPLSDSAGLSDEADAFRKMYNDTLYFQMNIISTIKGDSIANRHGKLFYYQKISTSDIDLNDTQIDSVSKSWGLNYLVKQQ